MSNKNEQVVSFKFANGQLNLEWSIATFFRIMPDGGFSCFIPSFNIHFSAKDSETINKKSIGLMRIYFAQYIKDSPDLKKGFKALILDIHKLGFKSPHGDMDMKRLLNNNLQDTKFKSQTKQSNIYPNVNIINKEMTLEMSA